MLPGPSRRTRGARRLAASAGLPYCPRAGKLTWRVGTVGHSRHMGRSAWGKPVLAPRAAVERGKPEGKVLEVRVKLREEDAGRASECARAEGLSRSEYLAVLVGEAMRELAKRASTSANRGGLWSPGQARHLAGMREALVGSTAQIAALGRNVNQIARALNGNPGMVNKQYLETLTAVAASVDRHVDLAGAVLLAPRPAVAARRATTGASDDARS